MLVVEDSFENKIYVYVATAGLAAASTFRAANTGSHSAGMLGIHKNYCISIVSTRASRPACLLPRVGR